LPVILALAGITATFAVAAFTDLNTNARLLVLPSASNVVEPSAASVLYTLLVSVFSFLFKPM